MADNSFKLNSLLSGPGGIMTLACYHMVQDKYLVRYESVDDYPWDSSSLSAPQEHYKVILD